MKFRDNAHALGTARGMEIETTKLINVILFMLSEPVLRDRESILIFEFHIRRSEGKPDKSLSNFDDAIRRGMFYIWRIAKRERSIRNRVHVRAFQRLSTRTNDTFFTKKSRMKRRNMNTAALGVDLRTASIKNSVVFPGSCRGI